jgi:hypothetical protein
MMISVFVLAADLAHDDPVLAFRRNVKNLRRSFNRGVLVWRNLASRDAIRRSTPYVVIGGMQSPSQQSPAASWPADDGQ